VRRGPQRRRMPQTNSESGPAVPDLVGRKGHSAGRTQLQTERGRRIRVGRGRPDQGEAGRPCRRRYPGSETNGTDAARSARERCGRGGPDRLRRSLRIRCRQERAAPGGRDSNVAPRSCFDRRPSAWSDGTRSRSRIPSESAAYHRPPRKATPRWSRDPWKNRRSDSPRCCETKASCAGEPMKGVLIIAEHLEGRLAPSTLELITTGRSLAAALGGAARIAVLGSGVRELADRLAGYTLDVLLAEHPALAEHTADGYVRAVRGIVGSNSPRAILVAHTAQGYDFA